MSPPEPLSPTSYEALAELPAGQAAVVEAQALRIAELERRLGMNSSNSGTPTSKESIGAAAHVDVDVDRAVQVGVGPGVDHHTRRIDVGRKSRDHIRQLEALGSSTSTELNALSA